jgi:hypothetical protein
MKISWLVLMSRSRSDSATTGLGNSGYQSTGDRLDVMISERLVRVRSDTSSYLCRVRHSYDYAEPRIMPRSLVTATV